MCEHFFYSYVKKYESHVRKFNMANPTQEGIDTARAFSVQSVPCLILLDMHGYEIRRWQGGRPPDMSLVGVEIGIGDAWGVPGGQ